jgi:biopolymer transport protein ExbD
MLDQNRSLSSLANRNSAEEARERRWENTFFMLNVIFLLILFFIVAANFDVQLQIYPPRSDAANSLPDSAMQLTVNENGELFLNGETLTRAQLAAEVRKLGEGAQMKIAADANLEAVQVAQLIADLSSAGVSRIGLVTLSRAEAADASPPATP